ncbi:MAG: PAS domain S-box protein [Bacteroidota bacterium]
MTQQEIENKIQFERYILDNLSDAVLVYNLEGLIFYANSQAVETFNREKSELIHLSVGDLHSSLLPSDIIVEFEANAKKSIAREWEIKHANGHFLWLKTELSPLIGENGNTLAIIAITKDISDSKQIEQQFAQSQDFLAKALDIGRIGIWDWDMEKLEPTWSNQMLEIYGYSDISEMPAYERWANTIHPDDQARVSENIIKTITQGHPYNIRFRIVRESDGEIRHLHVTGELIHDKFSKVPHFLGVARDITQEQSAETKLIESLEFNENIITNASAGIVVVDNEFNCQTWNPSMEKITRVRSKQAIGNNLFDFLPIPPDRVTVYKRMFQRVLKGHSFRFEDSFPFSIRRMSGIAWIKVVLNPNYNARGEVIGIVAIVTNVTDTKVRQQELKEYSERLRLATETAEIGVAKLDFKTWQLDFNKEFVNICGYTSEGVLKNPNFWKDVIHPQDADVIKNTIDSLMQNEEVRGREFRIIRPDGELRYIQTSAIGLYSEKGEIEAKLGVYMDITPFKKQEASLRQKNDELQKTTRELDTFVYYTSHNLRAPLANIQGIFEILQRDVSSQEKEQFLQFGLKSISELDRTIQNIIDYSYNNRADNSLVGISMGELIDNTVSSLAFMEDQQKIKVYNDLPSDLILISNPERVNMVFLNILSNAIKYSDHKKDNQFIRVSYRPEKNGYVFSIQDNGIGIQKSQQEKVFEMFYRASKKARGSGLGLYIVNEAVHQLKGHISFESEEGMGTTFHIFLPKLG